MRVKDGAVLNKQAGHAAEKWWWPDVHRPAGKY